MSDRDEDTAEITLETAGQLGRRIGDDTPRIR